ncbi:MAG: hypothetical protein KGS48_15570 [Bacteroidetes bacterium]|nr:hypothetical protein [Bacteroidota bacterium]
MQQNEFFTRLDSIKWTNWLLFSIWVVLCLMALFFNGTCDEGDSTEHYLFAHYAFLHPENFVNHWAKPVYMWFAAPAAQFGFAGIKLLNVTYLSLHLAFLVKIARRFETGNYWILPVLGVLAPMNLTHTLSGLTEPTFAFWITGGIALLVYDRKFWGYLVLSFLPMIRPEGLIIFCVLGVYMAFARDLKYLPLLAVGHLVVGLTGYWKYHDVLWTITGTPYATFQAIGERGTWYAFIERMPFLVGWAISLLLLFGLIDGFLRLMVNNQWLKSRKAMQETFLIFGFMLSFFIAHSIFFYNGWFTSLGLLRNFLCIMPLMVFIAYRGFLRVGAWLPKNVPQTAVAGGLMGTLALSMFLHRTFRYDLFLNSAQISMRNAAKDLKQRLPDLHQRNFYFSSVDVALSFNLDPFDRFTCREPYRLNTGEPVPNGSLVIWEDKFMPHEGQTSLDQLQNDKRLFLLGEYRMKDKRYNGDRSVYAFEVRNQPDSISDYHKWMCTLRYDSISKAQNVVEIAGKRAAQVDQPHEYGPELDFGLASFPPGSVVEVSFNCYSKMPGKSITPSLVISHDNMRRNISWRGRPFADPNWPAEQWQTVRLIDTLPQKLEGDFDKLKMYIWNPSPNAVYIDQFRVRYLSDK